MVSHPILVRTPTSLTALVTDCNVLQLNDVLSLCVGLWAVKVAHQKPSSKMYTYGVWSYHLSLDTELQAV